MCDWGNNVTLPVCVPAVVSYTGKDRWDYKAIDSCIVDLVKALNTAGILTAASCCGHGQKDATAHIALHDGRVLLLDHEDNFFWEGRN